MQNDNEPSVMFSLAMLTQQASKEQPEAKPVEDIAHISAGDVFTPLLASPAPQEPEPRRHRTAAWGVALGAVVAAAIAVPAMVFAAARPKPAPPDVRPTPKAITVVRPSASAITAASTSTAVGEVLSSPPAPHVRTSAPPVTTTHAPKVTKPPEAPKCCPGESDMECAMRRSVGQGCPR